MGLFPKELSPYWSLFKDLLLLHLYWYFSLSSLPPSLFIPLCVGDTGEDPFQGFSVKGSLQGSLSQVHSLPWEKVSPAVWLLLTAAGGGARRSE